jgi:hypothetical protein
MVTPVFASSIFEVVMACFNLSGVVVEIALRATMRVAPDNPENAGGFESMSGYRLFVRPVCRSRHQISAIAKPDGQTLVWQNQGMVFRLASRPVLDQIRCGERQAPRRCVQACSQARRQRRSNDVASGWHESTRPGDRFVAPAASFRLSHIGPVTCGCFCPLVDMTPSQLVAGFFSAGICLRAAAEKGFRRYERTG